MKWKPVVIAPAIFNKLCNRVTSGVGGLVEHRDDTHLPFPQTPQVNVVELTDFA